MSRYISETEFLLSLAKKPRYSSKTIGEALDDAPSIDIVFCKECKWLRYCETEDLDLYLDCDKPDGGGVPRNEDWFCADGEVRDE